MKKKKLIKKIKILEKEVNRLKPRQGIKQIGFHYLSNNHDENEYDDDGY